MKILFLKDKDYEKIIDCLSDDYRWKELLELFQESVVIPTDNSYAFSSENSDSFSFPGFSHKFKPPSNIGFVVVLNLFHNCTPLRGFADLKLCSQSHRSRNR